jgi:hypothetical protein
VANVASVRPVDRNRIASASTARPSLVSVPATAAFPRAPAPAAPASTPAPAATRPAPARPARRYGVEVATFILESRAVEERDRLTARISLPCRVSTSREEGTEVYSIVVGPLASPEEAVRLSEDLAERRLVGQARVVRWTAPDSAGR